MPSITWGPELADVYDKTYSSLFEPSVLDPMTSVLAELAGGGQALEFAAGTGRVALALSARGVEVHGLELSAHMAERLSAKPGGDAVPVTIGDMTAARVPGAPFRLVYLVANTIMNVTTQDDQLAVFGNAAAHLEPGGCFVVEVIVPQLRRVPPGDNSRVFTLDPDHVGIETFDDLVGQIAWSHHWIEADGRLVRHSAPYRRRAPSTWHNDDMADTLDVVLFDLDDTLLNAETAWRAGVERVLLRCPQAHQQDAMSAWEDAFNEHFPRYLSGELTFEQCRTARIRTWARLTGVSVPSGTELQWFGDYLAGYSAHWKAFEDVAACLAALDGLRLGVLTNGEGQQQRAKVAALGLNRQARPAPGAAVPQIASLAELPVLLAGRVTAHR
jgi:SAM-dependent methyltransferase